MESGRGKMRRRDGKKEMKSKRGVEREEEEEEEKGD